MPQVKDRKVSITQRAQGAALLEYGAPVDLVVRISGLSKTTLYALQKRLRKRGYDPSVSTIFEDRFFKDAPRSGRPKKGDSAKKNSKESQSSSAEKEAEGQPLPSEAALYRRMMDASPTAKKESTYQTPYPPPAAKPPAFVCESAPAPPQPSDHSVSQPETLPAVQDSNPAQQETLPQLPSHAQPSQILATALSAAVGRDESYTHSPWGNYR